MGQAASSVVHTGEEISKDGGFDKYGELSDEESGEDEELVEDEESGEEIAHEAMRTLFSVEAATGGIVEGVEWPTPDPAIVMQLRRMLPYCSDEMARASTVASFLKTRYKTLGSIRNLLQLAPLTVTYVERPGPRDHLHQVKVVAITKEEYLRHPRRYVPWLLIRQLATIPQVITLIKRVGKRKRVTDLDGPFRGDRRVPETSVHNFTQFIANPALACVYQAKLGIVKDLRPRMGMLLDKNGDDIPDDFIVAKWGCTTDLNERGSSLANEYKHYGKLTFRWFIVLAGDQVRAAESSLKDLFVKNNFHVPYLDAISRWRRELICYSPNDEDKVAQIYKDVAARYPQTKHATEMRTQKPEMEKLALKLQLECSEKENLMLRGELGLEESDLRRELAVARLELMERIHCITDHRDPDTTPPLSPIREEPIVRTSARESLPRARQVCSHPGCTTWTRSKRLCWLHGGGKRCLSAGCSSYPRHAGYCTAHQQNH